MCITMEDSAMLEHKSLVASSRRYLFYIDDSDFILFQRCLAKDGRHDFVSGSKTPGPNVFVDSTAIDAKSDSGPHHRYATGHYRPPMMVCFAIRHFWERRYPLSVATLLFPTMLHPLRPFDNSQSQR